MSQTSYFFKVSLINNGTKILLSYHIKEYITRESQESIARSINQKFPDGLADLRRLINFDILSSLRSYKRYTYNFNISPTNVAESNSKVIPVLKYLEPILAGLDLIDQKEASTKKIWTEIVREKNVHPLLVTGEKVYKLTLVEDVSGRPVRPTEAFQEAINEEVESIKVQYEQMLSQGIESFKKENFTSYVLKIEDFQQGFISFLDSQNNPCLAKKVIFYPLHIMFKSQDIRKIKQEYREKMKQEVCIVYNSNSRISVYESNGVTPAKLPHNWNGGSMCTGSYHVEYNVSDVVKAKEIVNHIEEMLQMINMTSLADGYILYDGELKFMRTISTDLRDICESNTPVQSIWNENRETVIYDGQIL